MHVRAKHSSLQSHKVRHSEGPVSRGRGAGLELLLYALCRWLHAFDCFPVPHRVSLWVHAYVPVSSSKSRKFVHVALLAIATALCLGPRLVHAQQSTEILPSARCVRAWRGTHTRSSQAIRWKSLTSK